MAGGKIDIGMTGSHPQFARLSEKALQNAIAEAILHKHYNRQDDWSNDFLAK
ncbi:MAG: hypothetical protein IPN71_08805 [Fibrobacteres bacterium]|nr:hypothetical protein [Fibrobacterota bacterium]